MMVRQIHCVITSRWQAYFVKDVGKWDETSCNTTKERIAWAYPQVSEERSSLLAFMLSCGS